MRLCDIIAPATKAGVGHNYLLFFLLFFFVVVVSPHLLFSGFFQVFLTNSHRPFHAQKRLHLGRIYLMCRGDNAQEGFKVKLYSVKSCVFTAQSPEITMDSTAASQTESRGRRGQNDAGACFHNENVLDFSSRATCLPSLPPSTLLCPMRFMILKR